MRGCSLHYSTVFLAADKSVIRKKKSFGNVQYLLFSFVMYLKL